MLWLVVPDVFQPQLSAYEVSLARFGLELQIERKTTARCVNAAEMYYAGTYFTIRANMKLWLSLVCAAATWPVAVTHIRQLFSWIDWIRLILRLIRDSLILSNHFCSSITLSNAERQIERKEEESWERRRGKEKRCTTTPAPVTNHQRPSSTAKISKFEPKLSGC